MKALIVIGVDGLSQELAARIRQFRQSVQPTAKVFWATQSIDGVPQGPIDDLVASPDDELFFTAKSDVSPKHLFNSSGLPLYYRLKQLNLSGAFVCGQTFYGGVLSAAQEINGVCKEGEACIIESLTDSRELSPSEHHINHGFLAAACITRINANMAAMYLNQSTGCAPNQKSLNPNAFFP